MKSPEVGLSLPCRFVQNVNNAPGQAGEHVRIPAKELEGDQTQYRQRQDINYVRNKRTYLTISMAGLLRR